MSSTDESRGSSASKNDGLPPTIPDFVEQELADTIDNIIPTRGYQMLPVVGLGGSAGSIPALQRFFKGMKADSGMAFVVILHLSPEFESTLAQILSHCTTMKVVQAAHGQKLEPNSVYVIPPGKHLQSIDGFLKLTAQEFEPGKRVAVDLFFRSLADTHGPRSLAVVLSGADADGAIGIKRIKERGGLTVAQDPFESEHPGMPRSAIATGMVDWVLGVDEMPSRLAEYTSRERKVKVPSEEGPQPAKAPPNNHDESEAALRDVLMFLRTRTGRDFSYYKRATIVRRIARRLQINDVPDLPSYLEFLRSHPGESGALLQDLLISVTNFFRDRECFEALELHLPDLLRQRTSADTLRVWVPACATGEEAYSLAMILFEKVRDAENPPTIQVFGCDLDEAAIQSARAGIYPDSIRADVSEERLQRFFVKEARGYRVRRELREAVLFAAHDLLKDPPFSRMDLVSCRNLMIYLNREAQERAMDVFHFALRQGGLLFLGSSESVDEASQLFAVLDKKHRVYVHKSSARITLPVPSGPSTLLRAVQARSDPVLPAAAFVAPPGSVPFPAPVSLLQDRASLTDLHFRLLERLAPPSVIVNPENEIVHLSESAGQFLQFTGGEPTTNLLRVVHPSLRIDLRAALFRAAETGAAVDAFNLPLELNGQSRLVDLRVSPAKELAPGFMLVVFESRVAKSEPSPPRQQANSEPVVTHLERELEHVKGQLRDVVEQYEANTEELKASNEELQAMNEELRSTTEELETSREELQSMNEELTTVNHELKGRVEELGHANSDLANLMASTQIATIFIDRDFRVLRYTPPAVEIFHFIPGDIGRPLQDLRDRLFYPQLLPDARAVLHQLTPVEREVGDLEGHWYLVRLLPYRTEEDRIGGVVLTFVDISLRKKAELALRESEERYRTLFNSIDEGFCVIEMILDDRSEPVDFRYIEVNPAFEKLTGLHHAVGKTMRELVPGHEDHWFKIYGDVAKTGKSIRLQERAEQLGRWHEVYAFRCGPSEQRHVAVLFTDVTRKKAAEEELLASQQRLKLIVENAREFAIFATDLDRKVTSWNSGAERLLGYTEAEIKGKLADEIFTDEDRAAGAPEAEAERAKLEGRAADERWHQRKDRTRFWGSGYMMSMRDSSGEICGLVKILHDRTEAKRSEEQLAKSREQLEILLKDVERARNEAEAAGRTKDHFLATLSHELRTPLTPVLVTADALLKRKDLPQRAVEGLEMICRNIEVQRGLVDDLLDVTRITRGKFELERRPIDAHEALRGALQICEPDFALKQQRVDVSLQAGDHQLLGDFARVQQVFWNLLKNAAKFTPEGGSVTVKSRNERNLIVVAIADTGIGIEETWLAEIFEAFRQGDTTISKRFGGLGLGLAIAKATVEALGGSIHAESPGPGKGSTFTVRLPVGIPK